MNFDDVPDKHFHDLIKNITDHPTNINVDDDKICVNRKQLIMFIDYILKLRYELRLERELK